jgi:hypothetical protein
MKLTRLIPAIIFLCSCNNNNGDDTVTEIDSSRVADTTYNLFAKPDSNYEIVNTKGFYVWEVDIDKKTMKRNPDLGNKSVNADSVISGLNQQYENILLEKVGFRGDTIKLKIKDSEFLTEQSGSSGAAEYIARAVINLTSVPGIKHVHIDFKEGSHAQPDTWSRKDFPGYIIIQ